MSDVIGGAREFIAQRVTNQPDNLKHEVMIMAFGRTAAIEIVQDFTRDDTTLNAALDRLETSESRGSTDLYNAYVRRSPTCLQKEQALDLAERFVVILTDGTHQAGDEANLRARALMAKESSSASIYTMAISGEFDEEKLRELASRPENFLTVENSAA